MSVYAMTMNIASLFALFIGMFIIYNSFAIAVTQRRAEIGILRALGATRGQIRSLFLGESAMAGLAGSAAGIGFGLLMAHGLTGQHQHVHGKCMGVSRERGPACWYGPGCWSRQRRVGVITSMVAAFLPARNAARVDPVKALQKGQYQVLSAGENRSAAHGGARGHRDRGRLHCRSARSSAVFYSGYLLAMLAAPAAYSGPVAGVWPSCCEARSKWRASGGRRAGRRQPDPIAAPHLRHCGGADAVAGIGHRAGRHGARQLHGDRAIGWTTRMNPDFFVTTSETISARTYHFPGQHAATGCGGFPGSPKCSLCASSGSTSAESR